MQGQFTRNNLWNKLTFLTPVTNSFSTRCGALWVPPWSAWEFSWVGLVQATTAAASSWTQCPVVSKTLFRSSHSQRLSLTHFSPSLSWHSLSLAGRQYAIGVTVRAEHFSISYSLCSTDQLWTSVLTTVHWIKKSMYWGLIAHGYKNKYLEDSLISI